MGESLKLAIKPLNKNLKWTTSKKTKILCLLCPGATHITFSTRIPLLWYRCYYPHRSRDALSPVCEIFFLMLGTLFYSTNDPLLIHLLCPFGPDPLSWPTVEEGWRGGLTVGPWPVKLYTTQPYIVTLVTWVPQIRLAFGHPHRESWPSSLRPSAITILQCAQQWTRMWGLYQRRGVWSSMR